MIESGGLLSDSWELGVAHKYIADHYFDKGMRDVSREKYQEAVAIFEWDASNVPGSKVKQQQLSECYVRLLDLEDEEAGPITETRAELCYKLANSYIQVNEPEGKGSNLVSTHLKHRLLIQFWCMVMKKMRCLCIAKL